MNSLGYREKLEAIDKAILVNANFLAQIVENPEIFGHDLDTEDEENNLAEPDPPTASHTHGDIAGRYSLSDSKVEKRLSYKASKDHLKNLPRILILRGILTIMEGHLQEPILPRHTNHPNLTWINSEVPSNSSFVIGVKRFFSPSP